MRAPQSPSTTARNLPATSARPLPFCPPLLAWRSKAAGNIRSHFNALSKSSSMEALRMEVRTLDIALPQLTLCAKGISSMEVKIFKAQSQAPSWSIILQPSPSSKTGPPRGPGTTGFSLSASCPCSSSTPLTILAPRLSNGSSLSPITSPPCSTMSAGLSSSSGTTSSASALVWSRIGAWCCSTFAPLW